jgi:hypothetical protein
LVFSVISFDPNGYGPQFAPLLDVDRRRPLDAGQPNRGALTALKQMTTGEAFGHLTPGRSPRINDCEMASCCLAGVWLLHDYLDESHNISQRIETPEGSYWHAIMHRREGDFSNAKYWYRCVGEHPVLDAVRQRVAEFNYNRSLGTQPGTLRKSIDRDWDPFEFVDLCEFAVRKKSRTHDGCLDTQQVEWESLFDYCYHGAIGR